MARLAGAAAALLLVAAMAAPFIHANRFRGEIRAALERALGRPVEVGEVRFSLLPSPGLVLDRVVIHERPEFGSEPLAYVGSLEAAPRPWSLWTGRLEFASIGLEEASINMVKTGPASEPGRWNFERLLSRNLITAFPEIRVRAGRINFKFGDTKSVFYLTNTDLDIEPPSAGAEGWSVRFSGQPARTDRRARGLGSFEARGRWSAAGAGRLELDVELQESPVGEMIALMRGDAAGIHGSVSARMRLEGPLSAIRIAGRVQVEDMHRWDLLPPKGQGWPLAVRGRLNLPAQVLELESSSADKEILPLLIRFRAANFLSHPRWGVAVNWNRFPAAPLLQLARHMGAALPEGLQMTGVLDGAIGYTGETGLQGELAFHDTALAIPNSPPVRFEHARMLFDRGQVQVPGVLVRTAAGDEAELEAAYTWASQVLKLTIDSRRLDVASLRAQAALAAVPWLEQVRSGSFRGQLRYDGGAGDGGGWNGRIELEDGELPLPGLAAPLRIASARVQIQGRRVVLDRMRGSAGKVALEGEYRYEPQADRPHRVRVRVAEADAAEVERVLAPSLRRSSSLMARLGLATGRVPQWLAGRHMEGRITFGALDLNGIRLENVRARFAWDGPGLELSAIQARVEGGALEGTLMVNLRGIRPVYRLAGSLKGLDWESGRLDAEGTVETRGTGRELLAGLRCEGTFSGEALDAAAVPWQTASGSFVAGWADSRAVLQFPELQIWAGGEHYTGRGATAEDGRLVLVLSSGGKEMRMSGTLAQLRVESPASQ
jgi:hypothetical protein